MSLVQSLEFYVWYITHEKDISIRQSRDILGKYEKFSIPIELNSNSNN